MHRPTRRRGSQVCARHPEINAMTPIPRFPAADVAAALGVANVDLLGCGAYGDTWHAGSHAVKIICVDGYPPERLAREVDGLSRVSSAHVVRLERTGTVNLAGVERPALYFEYVAGGDLNRRIGRSERPAATDIEGLLSGLLSGIRDLHGAQGTVHRDIKPANVALRDGRWGQPVILDLGLAKSVTETTVTVYPGLIGTTLFMAPEQLEGRRARKAADLFAVGATIRTVITGQHPFYVAGVAYAIDDALREITAGPTDLPPFVPTNVRAVLDRLVSPAEHDRGSASSNLRRLEQ